jgi:MFS family permease
MSDTTQPLPERLFTYDFVVLTLASAFGFCNVAIFYGFASYLERLGIDPAWHGWLLGAEPLAAFCLRPFLSVLVTPRNALNLARVSLVGTAVVLYVYQFAHGIGSISVVRLLHGVVFVLLVSSVTALLAQCIPRHLAGRAFGYFSLSTIVPYAVMPPVCEWLLPRLGREDLAYAVCALLMLPALALLAPLGRRLGSRAMAGVPGTGRPALAEVRRTLASTPIRLILLANLCLFMSTTLIFFFIKPFALSLGLVDSGMVFTVYTVACIVMRLVAGPFYDRLPKEILLLAALLGLAACMSGFAAADGPTRLLILSGAFGLSLGVAMPLMNAAIFEHSLPAMRGTNLNLMLFMMDTGYVFGPMAGGAILAAGVGYPVLFLTSGAFATAAGLLVAPLVAGGWRRWRRGVR